PSLISGRTWNPPTGQRSTPPSSNTCKKRTIPTRLLSRPSIGNTARASQNRQNRAKSTVISRQGSRSLARLRDEMEVMRRLEAMGTYTDDEINRLAREGKQRGHIAGVGWVLLALATASPSTPAHESTLNSLHKKVDFMMSIFRSDSKYPVMFSQFESGGARGSGGYRDEEEGADYQDDGDEDGDGDT
nr:F-box domain, leucine-rich repeat domain, L domain-like protein [Tanacetum cinerariifolium]